MLSREIKKLIERNMEYTRMLEKYDQTREFALDKIRRNFTISRQTYWKLKSASETTGKPMSEIIDALVKKL